MKLQKIIFKCLEVKKSEIRLKSENVHPCLQFVGIFDVESIVFLLYSNTDLVIHNYVIFPISLLFCFPIYVTSVLVHSNILKRIHMTHLYKRLEVL